MEEDKNEFKMFLHLLLNAVIVYIIFILLTIWMENNKWGGADIGRWGFQAALYIIQILIIFLFHRDRNKKNIEPSIIGATIVFILVFLIEITY